MSKLPPASAKITDSGEMPCQNSNQLEETDHFQVSVKDYSNHSLAMTMAWTTVAEFVPFRFLAVF